MRKSAFLALFLGTPFLVTACGDDSASGDGETGGDTDSTESGTTAPTTGSTTNQPDTGDTDETDSDDTGNGCTPEDECREHSDCLEGQTCLANCTCFGQGIEPECEFEGTGVYGDCVTGGAAACMGGGGACVVDNPGNATQGVCYFNCNDACDCPAPPEGFESQVACEAILAGTNQSVCMLDCAGGKACPDGMTCFAGTICMWGEGNGGTSCAGSCGAFEENAPCQCDDECFDWGDCCDDICDECGGSFPEECTPPVPPDSYQDCANQGPAFCNEGEECVQAEDGGTNWGVCGVTGCANPGECPEAPATGDAPVACGDLGDGNVCYLDCSGQQTCPDGMTCSSEGNCAFEGPGFALYEGFHSGQMPAGWTVVDVDGFTPAQQVSFVTDAWVVTDNIVDDFAAVSTSWYNPEGQQADDWLITPPVMLGAGSVLSWKALAADPNFPDGYEVRISTAGADVADFLANPPLFTIAAEAADYTHHTVDLAAAGYENVEVRIAFRNNTNDMFLLFVDDIAISQ